MLKIFYRQRPSPRGKSRSDALTTDADGFDATERRMHKGVTTSTVEGHNGDTGDEEKMAEGSGIEKKVEHFDGEVNALFPRYCSARCDR